MKFSEIKHKIKNLGNFKSLKEIKEAGLRIVRNTKTGDYWLIEENLGPKLIPLGSVAKIVTGIITGNNRKYYTKKQKPDYEPAFKTPTDHKKILLKREDAIWLIKTRNVPYKIRKAPILWVDIRRKKHVVYYNKDLLPFEHTFIGLIPDDPRDVEILVLILNSTICWLNFESLGRVSISGPIRMLQDEIADFLIINPKIFKFYLYLSNKNFQKFFERNIETVFTELGFDPSKPIREQEPNPLPDRKALDDIVFDALGLTEEERKEVYWAVAELVKNRLEKARSV